MNNIKVTDFNNIRKLKEVIELYADSDEKKKVLSREILTMDEGTFLEHFENTIREMDKETNKRLKEIECNSKSMVEHMTNMRAIMTFVEHHINKAGVETMEDLRDFFSASHHGLFGVCLIEELWFNKK